MKPVMAGVLVVAAGIVFFGQPVYSLWAAAVALAAAWALDPASLRIGLRFGVVLAIVFAAAVTGAVVTWSAGFERGAIDGGMVLLRLLVLASMAAVVVRSVDAEAVMGATKRFGLERLGLVLGLALNSLPRIVEAVGEVWIAKRMRSSRPIELVRGLPGLGEVLLAHTARIAEEAAAAACLRGHSALTLRRTAVSSPLRTVVVTGPPDSGKSAVVGRLAARLQKHDVPLAGFEQVGQREDGHKVGFEIRDLVTGERAPLARLAERGEGDQGTRFSFSPKGFDLGRRALERAGPGGVVIVDEIGPVELRGVGHMPAVERALSVPGLWAAVVVVRRTLVPSLVAAIAATDVVVVDVAEEPDRAFESVVEALDLQVDGRGDAVVTR